MKTVTRTLAPFTLLLALGWSGCQANPPALEEPAPHLVATGGGPVFQILPDSAVFRDSVPEALRADLPPDPTPFGNRVVRISGTIRVEATDATEDLLADSSGTRDSAAVEAEFVTEDGARWKVVQTRVAPQEPNGSPHLFAGLGIDRTVHGNTGMENPLMPRMKAALSMWGYADVYQNDDLVKTDAVLHIMVTSRARSLEGGRYGAYDVTAEPIEEIHLLLSPDNNLASPGGFLHVNWERSTVTR